MFTNERKGEECVSARSLQGDNIKKKKKGNLAVSFPKRLERKKESKPVPGRGVGSSSGEKRRKEEKKCNDRSGVGDRGRPEGKGGSRRS